MAAPRDLPELNPAHRFAGLDLLSSMVAVVRGDGQIEYANTAFEISLGLARRALAKASFPELFVDPGEFLLTLKGVLANEFSTGRHEAWLKRYGVDGSAADEPMQVHVIVGQSDRAGEVIVELVEIAQQVRQDREETLLGQAAANKELVRNLAHEIKNPLGGIRGAAQLLQLEVESRELSEYTQVIINEADRLQALVDRLLAPHRRPRVVADVNIHEVCERVRALVLAEFPSGLRVVRDYDTSIPEFRGDKEQLIQALLNVAHNAAQALRERMSEPAGGTPAHIVLRTRVARNLTIGKTRHRLALELHVEDNGPGVPEDIRDRIFYPLVSGREGGSGLGLTLAQTFVQQHGGLIECDSMPGKTVFYFLIPLN